MSVLWGGSYGELSLRRAPSRRANAAGIRRPVAQREGQVAARALPRGVGVGREPERDRLPLTVRERWLCWLAPSRSRAFSGEGRRLLPFASSPSPEPSYAAGLLALGATVRRVQSDLPAASQVA